MPKTPDLQILDNLIWHALAGRQAEFAVVEGGARRFSPDVAPFIAIEHPTANAYADLARLVVPESPAVLFTADRLAPPAGVLDIEFEVPLTQMIVHDLQPPPGPLDIIELGPADVPEMIDLVELTKPGPFRQRTIELGRYIGLRRDGRLVAMAGERMKPPGFTEISAVCTHPDWRGHGFASQLAARMATHIQDRGDTAILHTGSGNHPAISVYHHLGFVLRRELWVTAVKAANTGDGEQ